MTILAFSKLILSLFNAIQASQAGFWPIYGPQDTFYVNLCIPSWILKQFEIYLIGQDDVIFGISSCMRVVFQKSGGGSPRGKLPAPKKTKRIRRFAPPPKSVNSSYNTFRRKICPPQKSANSKYGRLINIWRNSNYWGPPHDLFLRQK